MSLRPVPLPGGEGGGTSLLYFDPDAFPPAVAGVARAGDQMSAVVAANLKTTDHAEGSFGAVGKAWLGFHQAWAGEAVCNAQALGEMVKLLPAASTHYQHADHSGATSITQTGGDGYSGHPSASAGRG